MPAFRIDNSTVSNGSIFDLRGQSATFAWNNFISTEPEISKPLGSSFNYRVPTSMYHGHDAPAVGVRGIINMATSATDTNPDGNLFMTIGWLGSFALVGSCHVLYPAIETFVGSSNLPAMIKSIRLLPDVNSMGNAGSEYLIPYNIELVLTSGPI